MSITSNKNADSFKSAFKGVAESVKGIAGDVSTALKSMSAQNKESHDATMDGMRVVVNELQDIRGSDENEVRSFVKGWANTCSGGIVVIALEGVTVDASLADCKTL